METSSSVKIHVVNSLSRGVVAKGSLGVPGLEMPVVVCEMCLTVPVDHGVEIEEFGAVVFQSFRALILS